MARIDDPSYPLATGVGGVVLMGYRPKDGAPGTNETVRVPTTLFPAFTWPYVGIVSANADHLHIYSTGGTYLGSTPLLNLGMPDEEF